MARPQNSPRGHFGKKQIQVGKTNGVLFDNYSTSNALLTANSTGLKVRGALYLSNEGTDAITQNSTAVFLSAGLALSGEATDVITQDSTAVLFSAGIALSGQASSEAITQNSTAIILPGESSIPTTDEGVAFTLVSNSTGVAMAVNTTGTTWKYLNVTSVQPT